MTSQQPAMVQRKKKHPHNRWMADERRARTVAAAGQAMRIAGQVLPAFLLCFAQVMGIPSGLHAAWLAALACVGESLLWPGCGVALAMVMKAVWGLPFEIEQLAVLGLGMIAPAVVYKRGMLPLMGWTGACMAPAAVGAWVRGTPAQALMGVAAMCIGALSAPVMLRAVKVMKTKRPIDSMEARVAVGYTVGMMLCGGGCMMLFGVNVGMLGASVLTVCMALYLGVASGAVTGMACGLVLALQGLPLGVSVALSVGGFLAGMLQGLGKRLLSCLGFAMVCGLTLLLAGASAPGCMAAMGLSAGVMGCMSRPAAVNVQGFFRRFLPVRTYPGDAYAADALTKWEKVVHAMARAVPSPEGEEDPHDAPWWREQLCARCPEGENCTIMLGERAASQAEKVWQMRGGTDDAWQAALEELRGLGCSRLYQLREGMIRLRQEDQAQCRLRLKAQHQRDMLVTHLTAMAGAARRFAQLSCGASWWDDMAAARLRKRLAELAYPAALVYVRRVEGHAQAAFDLNRLTEAARQAEELASLTAAALDIPMHVVRVEEDRVLLAEAPLWQVESGVADQGLNGQENGDSCYIGTLGDGRFLAAVSDGMGHGAGAHRESRQTVTLLRLCLEAGYQTEQTLTAVNGMMLLASRGERFSTVDLLTIDLWTGHAALDKLGAASSYLVRGRHVTEITGEALPLGIVEDVDAGTNRIKLKDEDEIVLMTDGVEDAFASRQALQEAVLECLDEPTAQGAAECLLRRAKAAALHGRKDDLTALVLRLHRQGSAVHESKGG